MDHKTDMNITEIDKYKKTEQHFYDGTRNRIQRYFGELNNKHIQIQQKSNKPQNSPRKTLTKIFNQKLTSIHYLYLQPKNQENVKLYNTKNEGNHKINVTSSLKEDKIHNSVSKLLIEIHDESQNRSSQTEKPTLT